MSKYYRISSPYTVCFAFVHKKSRKKWDISIGGKTKGSVWMTVKHQQAYLHRIGLDIGDCVSTEDMKKDMRTMFDIIECAIAFVFHQFPSVHHILFEDHTYIENENEKLYLSLFDLIEHGSVWYQRHFGAGLQKKHIYQEHIQKFIQHIRTPQSWESWVDELKSIIDIREWNCIKEELRLAWDQSPNPRDIFIWLKQNGKCDVFVNWFYSYFERITNGVVPLKTAVWEIRRENISDIEQCQIVSTEYKPLLNEIHNRKIRYNETEFLTGVMPRKPAPKQSGLIIGFTWEDYE